MNIARLRPFDAAQGEVALRRLRGRKVCERVLRRGEVWRGKHMKIVYAQCENAKMRKSNLPGLYVGAIASTKMEKSAVKRNRMRRRCREALRITVKEMSQLPKACPERSRGINCQLLIAPRLSSLTCDFGELLQDARNFLRHIGTH